MILSVGTLLARAKRKKEAIPFCVVTSLEMMQVVITEIERTDHPIGIMLDTSRSLLPLEVFISSALHIAGNCRSPVALIAQVDAQEHYIEQVLKIGVPAIQLLYKAGISKSAVMELSVWTGQQTARRGFELVGSLPAQSTPAYCAEFVHATGSSALVIPVLSYLNDKVTIPLGLMQDNVRSSKVPIIGLGADYSLYWLRKAIHTGISGFILNQALSEAYSGGLRTALRNRSVIDPIISQAFGLKAIQKTIASYVEYGKL